MKKIILFKENDTWMTEELIDNKPSGELVSIFGTHILPTAFTGYCDSDSVKQSIQALNPNVQVEMRG